MRLATWGPPLVAFGFVLVIWQVLAVNNRFSLPNLGSVVGQLVRDPTTYLATAVTPWPKRIPGVAISYAVALLLAIAMVQSRLVTRAILPLAVVLNVTPLIAIAPALVVAFSFGRTPRVALAALITFFPALIYSLAGLRAADPQALEVLQTLHASRWETLWRLRLPSSLPYQFAAARVVVPLGHHWCGRLRNGLPRRVERLGLAHKHRFHELTTRYRVGWHSHSRRVGPGHDGYRRHH